MPWWWLRGGQFAGPGEDPHGGPGGGPRGGPGEDPHGGPGAESGDGSGLANLLAKVIAAHEGTGAEGGGGPPAPPHITTSPQGEVM